MTNNLYVTRITGTGAAIPVNPGFSPRLVQITNIEGLCTLEWAKGLDDGYGYKTITAGTQSLITSGGITPDGDGLSFIIGADANINVSGEDMLVKCFR